MEPRVLVMAGGDGIAIPYINTIENKVSKLRILSALENSHESENKFISEIEEDTDKFYSVWGYSENDMHLKNDPPRKGDYIFITYKNAAIYLGKVFQVFESTELDYIWAGSSSWKYKLLIKDMLRIFIPDSQNGTKERPRKFFEDLCFNNVFAPNISFIEAIEKYYNKNIGFRDIINKKNKFGNFQAATYAPINYKEMLIELEKYCEKTCYECLIKVV